MKKLLSASAVAMVLAVSAAQAAEVLSKEKEMLSDEKLDIITAGATTSSVTTPGPAVLAFSGTGSSSANIVTGVVTATPVSGASSSSTNIVTGVTTSIPSGIQVCNAACTVSFTQTVP